MIIANLATYPPRAEFLPRVVNTIAPQVDRLNIVLNEYNKIPSCLLNRKTVRPIIPDHDTKDAGKFFPDCSGAEYVLLIDDDIIYPDDFVALSIARMRALGPGRYLGGYHCSIYRRPALWPISLKSIKANIRFRMSPSHIARFRQFINFSHEIAEPVAVDQIGSGAAIMKCEDLPSYNSMKSSQKFVDVRLARWCFEEGIVRVALPRKKEWLLPCRAEGVVFDETIVKDFTSRHHKYVADEIWRFAFKDQRVGKKLEPS